MIERSVTEPIKELGIYDDLKRAMGHKGITHITGLTDSVRPVFSYALSRNEEKSLRLFITYDEVRAREIMDICSLFGREVYYFPPRDIVFYQADLSGNLLIQRRMQVIKALNEWDTSYERRSEDLTVVTTFDALMEKMVPMRLISDSIITFRAGDTLDLEKTAGRLADLGYERESEAE